MPDETVPEASVTESKEHAADSESSIALHNSRRADTSRRLGYVSIAIAVIAAAVSALAYFHPAHNRAAVPQQAGDSKVNICSAYKATHNAVAVNTHMQSKDPNNQVADLTVAVNARLALIGGGVYLKDRLAANTTAPADVANAVDSFATMIEQLGINYLSNAGAEAQESLRHDLDSQITQLNQLCA